MRYRWVVLGAGTAAQASYSAIWFGVSVLAPELRDRYRLSLGELGVLIAASLLGSTVSLIPWGLLADRVGERLVLAVGLGACGAVLLASAQADGFAALFVLLALAGLAGASVQSASGRAVMQWFPAKRRGLALGIRQTAVPIGGFGASVVLPHLTLAWGFRGLGLACLATAAAAFALVREGPLARGAGAAAEEGRPPLRDRRVWRLSCGSTFLLWPQMCLVGFAVLFLHDRRGFSAGRAALVLAAIQVAGIAARIAAGVWSDRIGDRIRPLGFIALAVAALVVLTSAAVSAPLAVLLPAMIVAGMFAMSWNGLSFTAAAELAGVRRAGAAIGLQQTVVNASAAALPPAFGALVGAAGWRLAFALVAVGPLTGFALLWSLRE